MLIMISSKLADIGSEQLPHEDILLRWDVVLKLFVIIELFDGRGRPICWFGRLLGADRTFYKLPVSVELGSDSGRSTNQLVQKI